MRIFPGIEISNGKCVRTNINTGEYVDYGSPLDWALRWQDDGAECVHIIDLDAAQELDRKKMAQKLLKIII